MESLTPVPVRILIVEPDASLQSLLSAALGAEGYALSLASSLEEVPDQLAAETFALVLADVYVGRYHAGIFTPAHRLRRLVSPTPVGLLMTLPFTPEEARRAGFAFVLPMPFELEDLLAQVATTLQPALSAEHAQQVQVVERFFAARQREDWQAMLDLCTEDIAIYPHSVSPPTTHRRLQGQAAIRDALVPIARSAPMPIFTHFYYAALPKGLVARYVRLWTTPEGERRREAELALFHFREAQIAQIGMRPLLASPQQQTRVG